MTTVFNVLDYGADPTGTTSSHVAFQNAIDAAKAIALGAGYSFGNTRCGTVIVPKGIYTGIESLDCTECVGLTIKGEGSWGSTVYADGQSVSLPVFDCTQSNYVIIENLSIFAMSPSGMPPTVWPQCGVLFSAGIVNSSNKNKISDSNIIGWFNLAALGVLNSTNNNFYSSVFYTYNLNAPAIYVGKNNSLGFSSGYTSITATPQVANENAFFGCEIHNSKQGDPACNTIWLDGAQTYQMFGGIVDGSGSGQPVVYLQNDCRKILFTGVKFYNESAYRPLYLFYNDSYVSEFVCSGSWKDYSGAVTTQFGPGSWGSNIQLNGI